MHRYELRKGKYEIMDKSSETSLGYILKGLAGFLAIGALGYLGFGLMDKKPSIETKLLNFPEGYEFVSHTIPTKGQVTEIDRAKSDLDSTVTDSLIVYNGDVFYRIKPSREFTPQAHNTDTYGNTPYGSKENFDKYWSATREGTVTIKKSK